MPLDAILEVAIGLIFAWLVLSIATMEIQNWITQLLDTRAKFLEQSILEMFKNDQSLVDQFYNHPAIVELSKLDKKGRLKKPASIPAVIFAEAAMDVLLNAGQKNQAIPVTAMSYDRLTFNIEEAKILSPDLARLMERLFPPYTSGGAPGPSIGVEDFVNKVKTYRANIEKWFDNVMAQTSAWYKENAMTWAFGIGLTLAIVFNIDTVNISEKLWREPTIRQALVAQAGSFETQEGISNIAQVPGYFDILALPIGWTTVPAINPNSCLTRITPDGKLSFVIGGECRVLVNVPNVTDFGGWVQKLLGLVISAFAARLGAPFWFDLLKKLLDMRNIIKSKDVAVG